MSTANGVDRLAAHLERRGGRATRRELLRGKAGGARTAAQLDALLGAYAETHPGLVAREQVGGTRGIRVTTVVYAPPRTRPDEPTEATGDASPQDRLAALVAACPGLHPEDVRPKDTDGWGSMFGGGVMRGFGGLG